MDAASIVMERADHLARFSEEEGRITRSYGSRALLEAREAVRGWMLDAGMTVGTDAIGNLIGRYDAGEACTQTFLLGSHIDSVRDAGRYDGPLGVLTAIACVERLRARGERLPFAVEVVAFVDEEGLRYHASYLGSRVFAGLFDEAELQLEDVDGVPLSEAVRAMGGEPARLVDARRPVDGLRGYCEVHIEQGPVLEANGLPVGVVTSIAGQSRGTVTFVGEAGHAGTVPMTMRRDALCAAAEFVLAVEASARAVPDLIATVGKASVSPGVGNVIPGLVTVTFDVRHQSDETKAEAVHGLRERAIEIGDRRGVGVDWQTLQEHPAVPCSPRLVDLLARAVEATGGPAHRLASGAGHDAVSIAHLTDVSMLFVRCKGGISHHPDESVADYDVAAAIDVLTEFLQLVGDESRAPAPSAAAPGGATHG